MIEEDPGGEAVAAEKAPRHLLRHGLDAGLPGRQVHEQDAAAIAFHGFLGPLIIAEGVGASVHAERAKLLARGVGQLVQPLTSDHPALGEEHLDAGGGSRCRGRV